MRKKLSATRLAVATSANTLETRRKYNTIYSQCEKMPNIYNSLEKDERPQSDLKIVAIHTYDTDSTISTYGRLPLSPTHRHISTKQGRSPNGRPKNQRAKQIQGLLNPRKKRISTCTYRYAYIHTCRRNKHSLQDHQHLCNTGSGEGIHHGINGALPDEEEGEKHTPTADASTGRKMIFEPQHQGDADLLTGAVPTPTWVASTDANH